MSEREQRIVELDVGCQPEAAVSGAVLVQTEMSAFLTFSAMRPARDAQHSLESAGTALVEFAGCSITRFGYPNDEARGGIPYYTGLVYGIYEVLASQWIQELVRLNRFSFPNTKDDLHSRHFLFCFHDSTFECIADGIRLELLEVPYEQVLARIAARVVKE